MWCWYCCLFVCCVCGVCCLLIVIVGLRLCVCIDYEFVWCTWICGLVNSVVCILLLLFFWFFSFVCDWVWCLLVCLCFDWVCCYNCLFIALDLCCFGLLVCVIDVVLIVVCVRWCLFWPLRLLIIGWWGVVFRLRCVWLGVLICLVVVCVCLLRFACLFSCVCGWWLVCVMIYVIVLFVGIEMLRL